MAKYLQPWMNTAYSKLGLKETPGKNNTKEIMDWAKMLDLTKDYYADSVPWCGLFVAYIVAQNGIEPVEKPLWALNWAKFGKRLSEPAFGCIVSFKRNGGGHVGFYVSEDTNNYHILGGNQSDKVSITKIAKGRAVAFTWPPGMDKFLVKGRIKNLNMAGDISRNEA